MSEFAPYLICWSGAAVFFAFGSLSLKALENLIPDVATTGQQSAGRIRGVFSPFLGGTSNKMPDGPVAGNGDIGLVLGGSRSTPFLHWQVRFLGTAGQDFRLVNPWPGASVRVISDTQHRGNLSGSVLKSSTDLGETLVLIPSL